MLFIPDPDFLPIPDPGTRGQKGTGSRIRIRNTGVNYGRLFPKTWCAACLPSMRWSACQRLAAGPPFRPAAARGGNTGTAATNLQNIMKM
jgi:hypothetical protein